jgi:predicted RNA-binding Zn-ribbon protein involved in translation (DUF1610 family)
MKYCPRCKETKNSEDFYKSQGRYDGLDSMCKLCKKKYLHDRFKPGGPDRLRKKTVQKANRFKTRIAARKLVSDYLVSHPCVDCGEPDPIVLDFDHVLGQKKSNVSDMIHQGRSLGTLKREIEKCEVRCANCHRRVTHKRRVSNQTCPGLATSPVTAGAL